jgi:hypothetical protein
MKFQETGIDIRTAKNLAKITRLRLEARIAEVEGGGEHGLSGVQESA